MFEKNKFNVNFVFSNQPLNSILSDLSVLFVVATIQRKISKVEALVFPVQKVNSNKDGTVHMQFNFQLVNVNRFFYFTDNPSTSA